MSKLQKNNTNKEDKRPTINQLRDVMREKIKELCANEDDESLSSELDNNNDFRSRSRSRKINNNLSGIKDKDKKVITKIGTQATEILNNNLIPEIPKRIKKMGYLDRYM